MHPILDSLTDSQHEWLKKLLFTFNEGSIGKFEALAPLFPKEVWLFYSIFVFAYPPGLLTANSSREFFLPQTKNLLNGVD